MTEHGFPFLPVLHERSNMHLKYALKSSRNENTIEYIE